MMLYDPKKAVTTIIAKRTADGKSTMPTEMAPSESKTEDGEMDPRHAAAEDVMAAFHEKHAGKLMEALANFHDLHMQHMEKDSESGEPETEK